MKKRKPLKRLKYNLLYLLVKLLIFISVVVPRLWLLNFFGFLGRVTYALVKDAREKTIKHLTLVFGKEKSDAEIIKMAKQVFVMIGKNLVDVLRVSQIKDLEDFEKDIEVRGGEHLEQAFEKGKGILCFTCHMGAFELLATYVALKKYRPMVVGAPLKDKRLNDLLIANRSAHGAQLVEKGKDTIKLFRNLKNGGLVCVLIDQDTKVKSRFIDFFGMPAATPVGATIMALKAESSVVAMHIQMVNNKQVITIEPEMPLEITEDHERDIITNTQRFSNKLEAFIRKDPTQWVWMHERWKTKPGGEIR